jgi:hypothetical protein
MTHHAQIEPHVFTGEGGEGDPTVFGKLSGSLLSVEMENKRAVPYN